MWQAVNLVVIIFSFWEISFCYVSILFVPNKKSREGVEFGRFLLMLAEMEKIFLTLEGSIYHDKWQLTLQDMGYY